MYARAPVLKVEEEVILGNLNFKNFSLEMKEVEICGNICERKNTLRQM
jgi:hypothetical protein